MELKGWLDVYLDHLRVERALAPLTLVAYACDLAKLCAVAKRRRIIGPEGFDTALVSGYLKALHRQGLGVRSTWRRISAVRGFARFLRGEGILSTDPCELVELSHWGRRLP